MAWLVSVNFSSSFPILPKPLPSPTELCPKTPARFVVSNLRLNTATVKITSSPCIMRQSLVSNHNHHICIPSWNLSALPFLVSDVSQCPRMLTGYWVGPDTEDGCGIVEAFIHEIL